MIENTPLVSVNADHTQANSHLDRVAQPHLHDWRGSGLVATPAWRPGGPQAKSGLTATLERPWPYDLLGLSETEGAAGNHRLLPAGRLTCPIGSCDSLLLSAFRVDGLTG